jgi:hypothetical protein
MIRDRPYQASICMPLYDRCERLRPDQFTGMSVWLALEKVKKEADRGERERVWVSGQSQRAGWVSPSTSLLGW